MPERERLFTARFALMFGFSFTVFLSAFQLLPTAPFHILSLGGSSTQAGLFLAFLTYSSATSAPFMGGVADRLGKRRILLVSSLAISVFSALYAIIPAYQVILGLVVVHGLFWSGLLSASGAYITEVIPASRRAEGLSYYGFASIIAVAVAPSIGLWVFDNGGWRALSAEAMVLNLVMAAIAWRLPPDAAHGGGLPERLHHLVEWRVLISARHVVPVFLQLRGHHQLRCGLRRPARRHAEGAVLHGVRIAIIVTRAVHRPLCRPGGPQRLDRAVPGRGRGRRGAALARHSRAGFIASAFVFGIGFGSAYPIFVAHLMKKVADRAARRDVSAR